MPYFQDSKKIVIPGGQTATYTLPVTAPLDNLTVWVVGVQPTNGITAQPKLNGTNLGGSTVFPNTARIAGTVFLANDPAVGRRIIPMNKSPDVHEFKVTVDFTAGAAAEEVTVYAAANQLTGF